MKLKMKLKTIVLSVIVAATCIVFAACSPAPNKDKINVDTANLELVKDGELTVAIATDNQPFEYFKSIEPAGFDVDLSNQLANDLDLYLTYHNMEFNQVLKDVEDNKADIAISAIAIDQERAQKVNFSIPYFEDTKVIIDKKGNEITPQDVEKFLELPNTKLVVQAGTTCEEYAKAQYPKVQIVSKGTIDECFKALKDDQANLFLINQAYANSKLGNDFEIVKNTDSKEAYGIAINKDKPNLTKAINEVLKARMQDGTIDKMKDKIK